MQTMILDVLRSIGARLTDLLPRTEKLTTSLIEHVLGDPGILLLPETECLSGVW